MEKIYASTTKLLPTDERKKKEEEEGERRKKGLAMAVKKIIGDIVGFLAG